MLFNSFGFAIFLAIVFILYWGLPHKYRWILMLIASYYFYMSWNAKYVVIILFTTIISYLAAIFLERQNSREKKGIVLVCVAIICLGILFFFKYFNFVSTSLSYALAGFTIPTNQLTHKLLLPVGISFYTFQTLSYVIDVYRGKINAEKHFGYYATFISFFPQLVAGPIERTDNLLPQIKAKHEFNYEQATYGLKLMAWGFFKKIVIADTLSRYVSRVYDTPREFSGFVLVIATIFFSVQIYCDFSGYSDIAIGAAKLLGINLMTNFNSPYFSQSIKEFWSRWHISLSTWFRDYVYIPLGGNRTGKVNQIRNLFVTFLLSGLWHGANWTFVAWGGIHGIAIAIENMIISPNKQLSKGFVRWIRMVCVFLFISFAWIFFVSNSISDALYVVMHLFDGLTNPILYLKSGFDNIDIGNVELLKMAGCILLLGVYDYFLLKKDVIVEIGKMKLVGRWGIYVLLVLILVFFSQKGELTEFIYFQF